MGRAGGGVCNPYQFFGLPHIWPRGYPLDQIKAAECNSFVREPVRPLVLQVSVLHLARQSPGMPHA
jgi:hypothetical protein